MRLVRRGYERDHGSSSIELPVSDFLGSRHGFFTAIAGGVADFSTNARHEYAVDVSFAEFSRLVEAAAEFLSREDVSGVEKDTLVAQVRPQVKAILQLALACVESHEYCDTKNE